jgi:hypothetical protein
MDFIEQLPLSCGFTAILVVVDRLTKQGIFIPTTDNIDSPELARLFITHVFSKHGVPMHVTLDCGSEFVSHFFRSLSTALGVKLHFTSGYHPQANGSTECLNQTLETYIWMYCNYQQDDWADLLPLVEFVYNNAPHDSTGVSPFFANKGYHPAFSVSLESELTSARAQEYITDLSGLQSAIHEHLCAAQERYQTMADRKCIEAPEFPVGSEVYIKAQFFRTRRLSKKLSDKYIGPYKVLGHVGPASVTVDLPRELYNVHPVFHVLMLEPHVPDAITNRVPTPPPEVEVDGDIKYEISCIVASACDRRRTQPLSYRVEWAGYETASDNKRYSWIPAEELTNAQELVMEFHTQYPDAEGLLEKIKAECKPWAVIKGKKLKT